MTDTVRLWVGTYPPDGPEGAPGTGEGIWRLDLDPVTGAPSGPSGGYVPTQRRTVSVIPAAYGGRPTAPRSDGCSGALPADQRPPARRLFTRSNATAKMSTTPLTTDCHAGSTRMIDRPMFSTPMMSAPTITPDTRPIPPVTAVPPMKHAAIASSSYMVPAFAVAAPAFDAVTMPATPARVPMLTKIQKFIFFVLTPDRIAACRLPPIAYTFRPKTVR